MSVIMEIIQKSGVQKRSLLVQDWGGPTRLDFAGKSPYWIKKLIIGSTWACPGKGETYLSHQRVEALSSSGHLIQKDSS